MEARQVADREAVVGGAVVFRPIAAIRAGMRLALPVKAEDGRVLVRAGTTLNEQYAISLARRGVQGLYVVDGDQPLPTAAVSEAEPAPRPIDYQAEVLRRLGRPRVTPSVADDLRSRARLALGSERLAMAGRALGDLLDKLRAGADGPLISSGLAEIGRVIVAEVRAGLRSPFWVLPVPADTQYEVVHPIRSALLATRLGMGLGMREEDQFRLGTAAVLMDVGMARIPASRLLGERLDADVWALIHAHPAETARILRASGLPGTVCQAVAEHHERWDGGGYPGERSGADVFRSARLLNLASTYVALISDRPYRPAYAPHAAMEFLSAYSGEWYDPALVQLLIANVAAYGVGAQVELDDGTTAAVLRPHMGQPGRPIVRLADGLIVDLSATGNLHRSIARVLETQP